MRNDAGPAVPAVPESVQQRLFGVSYRTLTEKLHYDERTQKFLETVESRFSEPELNLDNVAEGCGMSKNNLNALLKNFQLPTAMHLVRGYRVYRAIGMACAHNDTFLQIALECGFDSASTFTRVVTGYFGCSPKALLPRGEDYRRRVAVEAICSLNRTRNGHNRAFAAAGRSPGRPVPGTSKPTKQQTKRARLS